MTKDTVALVKEVQSALSVAKDAMLDRAIEIGMPGIKMSNAPYINPEAVLREALQNAFQDLRMIAEMSGQNDCLAQIKSYHVANSAGFGSVQYDHEAEEPVAAGLSQAQGFLRSLVAAGAGRRVGDLELFSNILWSTAKLVLACNKNPKVEKDVRDTVHFLLKCAYPDLSRRTEISHPGKIYIPDFASRKAQSLAEFKFAENDKDLKVAYDDLETDAFGYSGYDTWASKFALIYLTSAFANQQEIAAHFESVGKPDDWTIIVVNGQ